ncbi:MAG: hypothetical protein ACRDV4_10805 [Acidimicrobiales bacterium]
MTRTKLRHLPTRLAAGTYILNSGLTKLDADEETAKRLHGAAGGAYPFLADMDASTFTKVLSATEIALGGVLVLPLFPSRLAGLGLGAFAGGLLGLYMKTPSMRREGSVRPSEDGMALAKDVWMAGIALSLLMDSGKSKSKSKSKSRKR